MEDKKPLEQGIVADRLDTECDYSAAVYDVPVMSKQDAARFEAACEAKLTEVM